MTSVNGLLKTISNPAIPYVGTIFGGLVPGELIVILGTVPDDADRFQVDLQCGSSVTPRADVAFHFNPRFKKYGCIVCNTLTRQRWGWEEITKEMPFQKGKPFEIVITVLSDKYQVSVNKRHLLLYNHRISLEKVDTLGIYGKVMIKTIKFGYNGEVPDGSLLGVSYIKTLDTGLSPGCMVTVKGGVDKYAKNFVINLRPSDSNDIALHLNAQVEYQVFVRNSYVNDSWGEEKEIANFPFTPGMYLELIIFCEAHQFKVAVNGVHTLEYKHRFKQLEKINTVEISGDIKLLDVDLKTSASSDDSASLSATGADSH